MALSLLSKDLFLLAVFFAIGHTDAAIPVGVYGESQGASQSDPTAGSFRVKVGAPVTSAGDCHQLISVEGFKVSDELELSCNTMPFVSANRQAMIVGDVLYAESSRPATLYQVKGRTCEKFTYEYLPDTLNIDTSPVTTEECREIRGKMKKLLTEFAKNATGNNSQLWARVSQKLDQMYSDLPKISSKPGVSGVSNNNSARKPAINGSSISAQSNTREKLVMVRKYGYGAYDVKISKPYSMNGKTVKNIAVTGPGIVSDVFTVNASEPTDVIKTKDKLIVGNFLISKEPGKIVIVKDNKCIQRTYAKDGTLQTKDLIDGECRAVRMEIKKARGERGPSPTPFGNLGQTTSNVLGSVGQAINPVNESIRLIVNYLAQIINTILNFITKNVANVENNDAIGALGNMASGIMELASKLGRRQSGNQSGQRNYFGGSAYENNAENQNSGIYGLPTYGLPYNAGVNYGRPGAQATSSPWYSGETYGFNGVVSNPMSYINRGVDAPADYGVSRPDEEYEGGETGFLPQGGFLNSMHMPLY